MFHKRILILFLLFFTGAQAFADTFVVTNNADSGPGTLREALTLAAANGSAVKDYINFNLPDMSEAGRTITLVTQLPDLSSNLVIDGTTQSGSTFGLSDARVEISNPENYLPFTTFNGIGVNDVEFYGLYIYDYTDISTSSPDQKPRTGISLHQSSNIIIGAANKGNRMYGYNTNMLYFEDVNGITIQSNVLGLNKYDDLIDPQVGHISISAPINMSNCSPIIIGGDATQGNIIFCYANISFTQKSINNKLSIASNNLGVFKDGKAISWYFQNETYFNIYTENNNYNGADKTQSVTADIYINNNIAGTYGNVFIMATLKGIINFTNNYFGITKDETTNLNQTSHPNEGTPIFIKNCDAQVNIGGADLSTKNFFAYGTNGIAAQSSVNIRVINNEFECLRFKNGYNNDNTDGSLPKVAIKQVITNNPKTTLKGTADPMAVIDIYSTESCDYVQCSIRKLIKTTSADASGNWQSDIFDLSGTFYVSATINNKTSVFKTFEIDTKNIVITNMRCETKATISGLEVPQGLGYYWIDESGTIVSRNLVLETDKPGKYQLVLGNGCITSDWFEVLDNRIHIYDSDLKKTNISCGTANGAIKDLFVYDPENKIKETTWTDASNSIVGHAVNVEGLTAGSYLLTVTTTDGCSQTYGPITLKNTTGPNIDESTKAIQATPCGQSTGSITNIAITGDNPRYSWKNELGQEVAVTKDLINQPAGKYTLQITDDSGCGPIYSSVLEILNINGITLNVPDNPKTDASCNKANGSIIGITAPGATKFEWLDANNNLKGRDPDLKNVPAGAYRLIASNNFGCSKTTQIFQIQELPITYPAYTITRQNACFGQTNGSISVTPDALVKSMRWVNGLDQTISSNQKIDDLAPDTYKLYFTNQTDCESLYGSYTIDEMPRLQPPLSNNVQLCTPGEAFITVNDIVAGHRYRLYESASSISPLAEQSNGRFKVTAKTNTSFYISQLSGSCESSRTEVQVAISLSAINIANTITPNGDGINDYWKIDGIENYSGATIQIFNRYGQKVFESKGYPQPFNGTANGKPLPYGVYYYIINLNKNCTLLSGNLTVIR